MAECAKHGPYLSEYGCRGCRGDAALLAERDALRAEVERLTTDLDLAVERRRQAQVDAEDLAAEVARLTADLAHAKAKARNARADADALAAENVALRARAVPEGWRVEWVDVSVPDWEASVILPGRIPRLVRDPANEGADRG